MSVMSEQEPPRTRLEQLLRQQHVTLEEFRKNYQRATKGTVLSERQAYRWVAGELRGLPYPQAQATLEEMFGEPVARLLGRHTASVRFSQPDAATGQCRSGE
jgi:ribosomal protein L22